MHPAGGDVPRHIAVFDCNVYLDIACLLGPPFSWEKFNSLVASQAKRPQPGGDYDSLRAAALCTSGRFAGHETLEVWTNAHIDTMVRNKAEHPAIADAKTGYCGLGWTADDAQTLVDVLITDTIRKSNGGTLGKHYPDGNPPLDQEDGMVYGACRTLAAEDPLAQVYCVTRDRPFLKAFKDGRLGNHTRVLPPAAFVSLVKAARSTYAVRGMRTAVPRA